MDVIDELLQSNQAYAQQFTQSGLPMPPSRKVAVVAAWTPGSMSTVCWGSASAKSM